MHSEAEFLEGREANCSVAMHVGCARWIANLETVAEKKSHLVYFYSGKQTGCDGDVAFGNPVANCYCPAHARQLIIGNPSNATKVEKSTKMQTRMNNSDQARKKRKLSPPRKNVCAVKRAKKKDKRKNKAKYIIKAQNKKDSPKPFGKRESAVAISGSNKDHYNVSGRSVRAMKSKPTANNSSGDSTKNDTQDQVKSEHDLASMKAASKPTHCLRNLLDKVADTASLQAKLAGPPPQPPPPAAAASSTVTKDGHISISHTPMQFARNIQYSTTTSSAPKPALNKPVGILKKKGPGPINTDGINQVNSPAKTNVEGCVKPPSIKHEPLSDSSQDNHHTTSTQHTGSILPDTTTSS